MNSQNARQLYKSNSDDYVSPNYTDIQCAVYQKPNE